MITATRQLALNWLESIGEYMSLIASVFVSAIRRPPSVALVREQLFHIGVMSFGVVAITGFTTGFVLAAQSFYQLGEKGLSGVTGVLVAKSMITELGPILTAFMVTGRVGSAMCAELGSMRVTEQIDAIRSMAVNPYGFLVAPRFIAGALMIPLLALVNMVMGILGGYVISVVLFNMPSPNYFTPMPLHITIYDLIGGGVKSMIFGILLVTVCCYKGMKTQGGAAGVGKSTTDSVVTSYVLILIFDLFLTMGLNTIFQMIRGTVA